MSLVNMTELGWQLSVFMMKSLIILKLNFCIPVKKYKLLLS